MSTSATALGQALELDLFEGPLDLLLTLVLREEVDLLELPLAELVEAALGRSETRWDPVTAGELIVLMAATAELKARVMLGEPIDDEPDPDAQEARERLAGRLIAHAPFQRAAAWLGERAGVGYRHHYRRLPVSEAAPLVEPGRVGDLAELMAALLVARPQPSLAHLTARRVSMPELLVRLRDAIARARRISFDGLVADAGPLEEGMTLLAALEMARRGEVQLRQEVAFGDIAITRSST